MLVLHISPFLNRGNISATLRQLGKSPCKRARLNKSLSTGAIIGLLNFINFVLMSLCLVDFLLFNIDMREDTSSSFIGVRKNELCNLLDDSLVLIDLGCFSDFARLIPTLAKYSLKLFAISILSVDIANNFNEYFLNIANNFKELKQEAAN